MYDTPTPGSVIYAKADYFAGERRRLTKGKAYVVDRSDRAGLWINECDAGHNCCWGTDWYQQFTTEALTQPFTLLDDAGRAALRVGDRVLIEVTVERGGADGDGDGDISVKQDFGRNGPHHCWAKPSAVYALLAPAPKPIAVGDAVRISGGLTGATGKVLAFTSAGVPVVEFVDGDGLTARTFDASCLEAVS